MDEGVAKNVNSLVSSHVMLQKKIKNKKAHQRKTISKVFIILVKIAYAIQTLIN